MKVHDITCVCSKCSYPDQDREYDRIEKEIAMSQEMNPSLPTDQMNPSKLQEDSTPVYNQPPRTKSLPSVLHSFPTLRRGKQQLRVRIVQYPKSEPLLDIREFITGEEFNGFSKKGICINLEQATSLFENVELIMKALSGTD